MSDEGKGGGCPTWASVSAIHQYAMYGDTDMANVPEVPKRLLEICKT